MPDAAGTCTPAEAAVMELLRGGPAALGYRTEARMFRPLAPGCHEVAKPRYLDPVEVRMVESRPARALAKAGWVLIDAGGTVTVNPEGPAA